MKERKFSTYQIVFVAVMAALVCVVTFFRFPLLGSKVHFANAMCLLSGIDTGLHEAAMIDGASRLQRIWHINLTGILPTITIMLILQVGNLMTVGFEKAFLMQNPLNLETSEIISTFVYKMGLNYRQYSYSTAIGLFNSVINMILLVSVNTIAGRLSETSLW